MSDNRQNTKVLRQRRYHRRQWLTFVRMIRYGINNFSRNTWLTVAATVMMTITLLVIFVSVATQNILQASVQEISSKVDMSIYLKTGTTIEQADPIMNDLRALSNVKSVSFVSSEEARQKQAEDNKNDVKFLEAISEATNKLPATVHIQLYNINDTSQLDGFVADNTYLKDYIDSNHAPSFAGDRRDAIKQISNWTVMAQRIGVVVSLVFVAISSLIIFNTIRMAIFSRKEEIKMMKLIGADKQFIRGPFVVEAMVYGFIGALFATAAGWGMLILMNDKLSSFGIDVESTLGLVQVYIGFVLLIMIVIGALIGTISSFFATRRYLKV